MYIITNNQVFLWEGHASSRVPTRVYIHSVIMDVGELDFFSLKSLALKVVKGHTNGLLALVEAQKASACGASLSIT